MDSKKKSEFVRKMGKKKKKQLPRKKFAAGGATALGGPTTSGIEQNASNPNAGVMGSINAALGLNNNYQASGANLQQGTNAAQLNQAYTGTQNALNSQQGLVDQFMPGVGSAVGNQNTLADQYLAMSRGEGPNPALAQLAQTTQQNVANQNALMAGQRGASSNVGLMARQAAQQGAATQQQAAGQAATLEAQQQIAAQQNLQNLAASQISQAGQAVTGLNSAQQNEQSILQNANTSLNNANVGMQSNINNVNSQTAAANQNMASNTLGGIMSAASSIGSMFGGMAKGGVVTPHHVQLAEMNAAALHHAKRYAEGGEVDDGPPSSADTPNPDAAKPQQEDSDSAPAPVEQPSSSAPDLGSFKASSAGASAPQIGSTPSLPENHVDLGKDTAWGGNKSGGGGGGGGGGGMGGMMSMAAMLADGGQIAPNPLMGGSPGVNISLGAGQYHPGSASSGPSIGGQQALPANTTNFSKIVDNAMKDKSDSSKGQSDDDALQGYLDADSSLGSGNEEELPASNDSFGMMAAHGGMAFKPGHFERYFAKGGSVPAMVSPGEIYLNPDQVHDVVNNDVDPKDIGHKFSGKAKVKGDSYSNDTIPATLQEGGVVIDREHMGSKEKRKLFVHKAIAKKRAGGRL